MSDSYDMKEVEGVVYEVDCSMITLGAVDVG
jgi:Translationally controlled tumour protein